MFYIFLIIYYSLGILFFITSNIYLVKKKNNIDYSLNNLRDNLLL